MLGKKKKNEGGRLLADLWGYVALISQVAKFGSLGGHNSSGLTLMILKPIRIDS